VSNVKLIVQVMTGGGSTDVSGARHRKNKGNNKQNSNAAKKGIADPVDRVNEIDYEDVDVLKEKLLKQSLAATVRRESRSGVRI
jgi:hypothetical protein